MHDKIRLPAKQDFIAEQRPPRPDPCQTQKGHLMVSFYVGSGSKGMPLAGQIPTACRLRASSTRSAQGNANPILRICDTQSTVRLCLIRNHAKKDTRMGVSSRGSGSRIRTLTNRSRICRATFTQIRYILFSPDALTIIPNLAKKSRVFCNFP